MLNTFLKKKLLSDRFNLKMTLHNYNDLQSIYMLFIRVSEIGVASDSGN